MDSGQWTDRNPRGTGSLRALSTVRCPLSPVSFFRLLCLIFFLPPLSAFAAEYPPVVRGVPLTFPADEGSHPEFRIEWWYVTGWLQDDEGRWRGFQVTFFRNRPGLDEDNPSRFAAQQLLFAHAAISDPAVGRLLHDERSARAGFGLAEAKPGSVDVVIEDWSLRQQGQNYHVVAPGKDFVLELDLTRTQPPLLQERMVLPSQGLTQGRTPFSRSAMMALVISE